MRFLQPAIDQHPESIGTGVLFNGSSSHASAGSDASIDDLPAAGLFTVDGWFRYNTTNKTSVIAQKGNHNTNGWKIYLNTAERISVMSMHATSYAITNTLNGYLGGNKWHHFACFYDNATLSWNIAIDGAWWPSLGVTPGVGAYVSDAAVPLFLSRIPNIGGQYFTGTMSWLRLSGNDRYGGATSTDFTPPELATAPAIDGNTVEQWNMDEGSGITTAASVNSPTNDTTLISCTWEKF